MLNQIGSGSISCLRLAVEPVRLVRSNERQDLNPFFLCEPKVSPRVLGHVGAVRVPAGTCFST